MNSLKISSTLIHPRLWSVRQSAWGSFPIRAALPIDGFTRVHEMERQHRFCPLISPVRFQADGGRKTAKTLSELVIHDSKNSASSALRLSSAIAPARQNQ